MLIDAIYVLAAFFCLPSNKNVFILGKSGDLPFTQLLLLCCQVHRLLIIMWSGKHLGIILWKIITSTKRSCEAEFYPAAFLPEALERNY